MNPEGILAVISILTGGASLLASIYTATVKITKIEVKVDTMWDFQMRRAEMEIVGQGLGKRNSPLRISEEAKSWLSDIADELRDFYQTCGKLLSERELFIELERLFGEKIVNRVCAEHRLSEGACLLIAAEVAREGGQHGISG